MHVYYIYICISTLVYSFIYFVYVPFSREVDQQNQLIRINKKKMETTNPKDQSYKPTNFDNEVWAPLNPVYSVYVKYPQ